jgi:CelD/BcsL family acetyltransferase involved in cellulose biosynthesis
MYESRIKPAALMVETPAGFPPAIDDLAEAPDVAHHFLRAAWYRAGAGEGGKILLVKRSTGEALAAIPTTPFGPAILGARKVPGCYWPFRGALIAHHADPLELAQALSHPQAKALGPVWRLGPVPANDAATLRLIASARQAGWSVLSQQAGTVWTIDLDAARAEGWPRASTAKRLGRLERRLAKLGAVEWQYIRGSDWNEAIMAELGAVEEASWVGSDTDGSGAKFMRSHQRALWRTLFSDPRLADMVCATILRVDGRAVAFSLDLDDGPVQYGIVGTYRSDFGKHEVGKLVNYRTVTDAITDGQSVLDLGAGDSGYKREMGAMPGYDLVELLFVRNRWAAKLLRPIWRRFGA